MKFTNKHGLPEPLVAALTLDDYQRGDAEFTASELPQPPRIAALRRLHDDELVEDVADRAFMLSGKMMHLLMERMAGGNVLTEERLRGAIGGVDVSGQLDHYTLSQDGTLTDWKETSWWHVKDGCPPDWEAQENVYAELLRQHGFPVAVVQAWAKLRSWSMSEADRNPDMPLSQWLRVPVPLWPLPRLEAWVRERAALHRAARAGNIPLCSPEERWQERMRWAAKKAGNQRATKVFDTAPEAAAFATSKGLIVESRPGADKRCMIFRRFDKAYCPVVAFCDHGQRVNASADPAAVAASHFQETFE